MNKEMIEKSFTTREFNFLSNNNYTEIYGKMWIPTGEIIAILQLSHGMQEHIGRYEKFAQYMAERGILVVGNDHMGHGKSINGPEDMGYFSIPIKGLSKRNLEKVNSSAMAVKDLHHITMVVKKHYPGIPYILLGHSMGSFFVRRYIIDYKNVIDAAIIVGTGNYESKALKFAEGLAKSITVAKGDRYRSEFANEFLFGSFNKKIKNPSTKYDWICSDTNVVEEYINDEKCGVPFTMNGINMLVEVMKYINRPENIDRISKDLVINFISGMEDPVGKYGEDVKTIFEQYKLAGIKNMSMELYEGCRHEILNETINKTVFGDIYDWIIEKVVKA